MTWRPTLVWLFILALIVLRHDFWQWERIEPLLWGWAPLALWYHVAYTLLCVLAFYLLTRWAWPDPPEMEPGRGEMAERPKDAVTSTEQARSERSAGP